MLLTYLKVCPKHNHLPEGDGNSLSPFSVSSGTKGKPDRLKVLNSPGLLHVQFRKNAMNAACDDFCQSVLNRSET